MTIGRGPDIDIFFPGIFNHLKQIPVQIRLSLEIESKVTEAPAYLIEVFPEIIQGKRSGSPCKSSLSGMTFRAMKVAMIRWFYRNKQRASPVDRFSEKNRQKVTRD
jgi:hypothetical protein